MDPALVIGPDEQVCAHVRRHWINVVPTMGGLLVISVIAIGGFYLLGRYSNRLQGPHAVTIATVALLALLVLGLVLAYVSWVVYRQNCLIITTKNLYQVTQGSLFNRQISQFSLERLQDVSAAQNGVLASILGYGNVTVETAGEEENFVFRQASHPRALASQIMSYHQAAIKGGAAGESAAGEAASSANLPS